MDDAKEDVLAPPAGSLAEQFNLSQVIDGLLRDLEDLRAGKITVQQAKASALLGKTAIRGMSLMVSAQRLMFEAAKPARAVRTKAITVTK